MNSATLLAVLAGLVWAEAPNLLTYQGRLKEAGSPVTGTRQVQVYLCDAETAGTCAGTGEQAVAVSNALFRTTFTVPSGVDLTTGNWYLEVRLGAGGTTILSPRERLSSSPYALVATSAATVAAGGVGTAQLANGAVTDAKIAGMSASKLSGPLPALDGSALTGVTAAGAVAKAGDTMTGQLTLAGSTLSVQGNAFSVGGTTLVVSGGKVGLGTAAPGERLEVAGGAVVTGNLAGAAARTGVHIYENAGGFVEAYQAGGGARQLTVSGDPIIFRTTNGGAYAERARFSVAGNLGLGTANPSARLAVKPSADGVTGALNLLSFTFDDRYLGLWRGSNGGVIDVVGPAVTPPAYLGFAVAGLERARVDANGNFGIGMTPSDKLDVAGAIRSVTTQPILQLVPSAGQMYTITADSPRMNFKRGSALGTISMSLLGDRLGVGTSDPAARMHVSSAGAIASDTVLQVSSGTGVGQELLTVKGDGKLSLVNSTVSVNGASMFLVPTGAVMFFNLTSCPGGWSELGAAAGRYLVARPVGGSTGTVVGTALSQGENRETGQHNHTFTGDPLGSHAHSISDPGHAHNITAAAVLGSIAGGGINTHSSSSAGATTSNATGITINVASAGTPTGTIGNAGAVGGTNAPYLQLLLCQKD